MWFSLKSGSLVFFLDCDCVQNRGRKIYSIGSNLPPVQIDLASGIGMLQHSCGFNNVIERFITFVLAFNDG